MSLFRTLFGAAPMPTDVGAFALSPLELKLATSSTTGNDGGVYDNP